MKYSFSIHFDGEVNSTPEEDAMEGIDKVIDVVKGSFEQDLLAGVSLNGMSVHVNRIEERTQSAATLPKQRSHHSDP